MSRNNRDYENRNNNEQQSKKEERVPLELEIEKATFGERSASKIDFVTSTEICNIINTIMRGTYEDYEGSKFYLDGYGRPFISLYFHHRLNPNDGSTMAFSQNVENDKYKNKTMARVMQQNRMYREGNQYKITDEGKDILGEFVSDMYINKKGNINWEAQGLYMDTTQPGSTIGGAKEAYTLISSIDPIKVLNARFGNGDNIFIMEIVNSIPSLTGFPSFVLKVTEINQTQLDRCLRNAGVVNPNGLGIIR